MPGPYTGEGEVQGGKQHISRLKDPALGSCNSYTDSDGTKIMQGATVANSHFYATLIEKPRTGCLLVFKNGIYLYSRISP